MRERKMRFSRERNWATKPKFPLSSPSTGRKRSLGFLRRAHQRAPEAQSPAGGGEWNRVALVEVNPFLVMAYWEAAPRALAAARQRLSDPEARLVLRFGGPSLGGEEDPFDIRVENLRGSRFLDVRASHKLFRCELGVLAERGRYSTLARSNFAQTPREGESELYEESYRTLSRDALHHPGHAPSGESKRSDPERPPPPIPAFYGADTSDPRGILVDTPAREVLGDPSTKSTPIYPPGIQPIFPPAPPPGECFPEIAAGKEGGVGPSREGRRFPVGKPLPEGKGPLGPGDREQPDPETTLARGAGPEVVMGLSPESKSNPSSFLGPSSPALRFPREEINLELQADVVVYGRTKPGTRLYLSGSEVPVLDDGTFEARFALPPDRSQKEKERNPEAEGGTS